MRGFRWRSSGRALLAGLVAVASFTTAASIPPSGSSAPWLVIVLAFAAVGAFQPAAGVQALAAGIPAIAAARIAVHGSFDWTSLIVASVIAGASARCVIRPERAPRHTSTPPVVLFAIVIGGSLVVALSLADAAFARSPQIARHAVAFLLDQPLWIRGRLGPVSIAAPLLLGLALSWIARSIEPQDRRQIVGMLVVGAAAAAALNIGHAFELALRTGRGLSMLWTAVVHTRISVHVVDVNAAGSYFVFSFFTALGLARGSRRAVWLGSAGAVLAGTGVVLSGSRTAMLVAAAAVAAIVARRALRALVERSGFRTVATVSVMVVLAVLLIGIPRAGRLSGSGPGEALRIRAGMGAAALRATATHPLFGIGVGEFYNRSPEFMSREMLAIYPRENAHNNYLQILAELGVVGFAAFLWLLYASLAPRRSGLEAFWTEGQWNGLHVGLIVFLVTCLSGHPLLVPEVAYIFWIALGLAAANRQEAIGSAGSSRRARTVAAVLCAFVLISLPIRISSARQAKNLQDVVFGVSHWRRDATGVAYRRLAADATFFIPASGTFVDIPLRVSEPYAEPVSVSISFDNVVADRVVLEGTEWRRVHLLLPNSPNGKWIRVRLMIEPPTAPTVLLGTLDQR